MDNLERSNAIVGFNNRRDRQKDDYYATPVESTAALLSVEKFDGKIWEPCCGEGHMAKELERHGYYVESTDLVDRGFGDSGVDFLMEYKKRDNIVTNPPYKNALAFVRHATDLANRKVAMLLKLNFLEGVERSEFFKHTPPKRVHVFKRRQALMKNGVPYVGGMMALAWYVWEGNHQGDTVIKWI